MARTSPECMIYFILFGLGYLIFNRIQTWDIPTVLPNHLTLFYREWEHLTCLRYKFGIWSAWQAFRLCFTTKPTWVSWNLNSTTDCIFHTGRDYCSTSTLPLWYKFQSQCTRWSPFRSVICRSYTYRIRTMPPWIRN